MKRKKYLVVILALLIFLGACGNSSKNDGGEVKIGIIQFAQHPSLDNCREGFIEGLKEKGFVEGENLKIDYENGQASTGTTGQIANMFVSNKYDLIGAIATPAAMSAYTSALGTDIPVIYTAINDPIKAQLANDDKTPKGNATGTSDKLPVEEQLKLIREILPEAKKLGIMYTTSEANSISTIEEYEKLAGKYDFELITESISQSSDIPLATDRILEKVDCLTNITDNTVVNSLATILNKANQKSIPVFGSEIEQVKNGCLAAEGIDYFSLGKETGIMAGEILLGEKEITDMKYQEIKESSLYINKKVSEDLNIDIDEALIKRASQIFDSIEK